MSSATTLKRLLEGGEVRFGTSGLRGPIRQLTDRICYACTMAFLAHLERRGELSPGDTVSVGGDLRPSTPRIMRAAARALADRGYRVHASGRLPSPALCYFGLCQQIATIMITGSHIPEDRNGMKFTGRGGEITKADEAAILTEQVFLPARAFDAGGRLRRRPPSLRVDTAPLELYLRRYLDFFPPELLRGKRIGVYQHSSVGRDVFPRLLRGLGADAIELGRSRKFLAVDTEALPPRQHRLARRWAQAHGLDALVSADGDADRPLVADERGEWFRGDAAGMLCAAQLGAEAVVLPVSCSSLVERSGFFRQVLRTRIGSPYVIEGMQKVRGKTVVGFEANGGFLLNTPVERGGRRLAALPTRDAAIVPLALLERSFESRRPLSRLLENLPRRFSYSERLRDFPTVLGQRLMQELGSQSPQKAVEAVERLLGRLFGRPRTVDVTDGVRVTFMSGEIVHLRPSGNAPELRCYSEADSQLRAKDLCTAGLHWVEEWRKMERDERWLER